MHSVNVNQFLMDCIKVFRCVSAFICVCYHNQFKASSTCLTHELLRPSALSFLSSSVFHCSPLSSPSARRTPNMPAVHREHDAGGEDVPVAVHRVQVVQPLWHLRERCMYDVGRGGGFDDAVALTRFLTELN